MDQIKHLAATGALKPDDQLPTVRQLAADLRVNFNTVARAYRLLDEAGLISTQQGRGTYILGEQSGSAVPVYSLDWLARRFVAEAAQLGFTPEDTAAAFDKYLQQWRASGALPADDPDLS
ncbi:MAG: GntR family transcriptional regulator [Chloroflexi bacterium]|nr:GntR family transcriptional regulator [Chloroflexota bacterium]